MSSSSPLMKNLKVKLSVEMEAIESEKPINFSTTTAPPPFEGCATGLIEIHLKESYQKQKRWWTKEGVILDNTLIEDKGVTRSLEMGVMDELHIFLLKQSCALNVSCLLNAMGFDDDRRYPRRLYESLKDKISTLAVFEATQVVLSSGGMIDDMMKSLTVVVNVEIVKVEEVDDEDLVVVVPRKGKGRRRRVYEKERLVLEKKKKEWCGFCRKKLDAEEKVVRIPCSHLLHVICLGRQLEVKDTCPVPGCGEILV